MSTPFSEIFDLFMLQIKDWRLVELFNQSQEDFENYLTGFLELSIPDFSGCNQTLLYNYDGKEFLDTLSLDNKTILAQIMVEKWLEKEIQDINQMNLHLQDRDFKVYSESQNLREKSFHLDKVKEYNSQRRTSYSYNNADWKNWLSGTFYNP